MIAVKVHCDWTNHITRVARTALPARVLGVVAHVRLQSVDHDTSVRYPLQESGQFVPSGLRYNRFLVKALDVPDWRKL